MLITKVEHQNVLSSVKIVTRISYFLRELSEDNSYVENLISQDLHKFILNLAEILNHENCEFVANMTLFYLNVIVEKGGASLLK